MLPPNGVKNNSTSGGWVISFACVGGGQDARRTAGGTPALRSDGDFWGGLQQGASVWMLRLLRDLPRISHLNNFSAVHDGDARCQVAHYRHRVRDEEISQANLALQLRQQIDNLRSDADIQRRNEFVRDNELGAQGQGAGDSDALPLSAAELVRKPGQDGRVEADGSKQFGKPGAARGQSHFLVDDQRFADDVFHIHSWIERTEGVLEDDLHIAAKAAHFTVSRGSQVAAFETYAAGTRFYQAQHKTTQGALSRSRFADQAESLAGVDVERHAVDGADFALGGGPQHRLPGVEDFGQISDFD